jgi:hypothetical protein
MKKILVGCLAVALLLVVLVVAGVWWMLRTTPALEATLTLPLEAQLEAPVDMVVTATNPHAKPVTLDSIDIDDAFLAGFQVVRIEPEPEDTTELPVLDQRSWAFNKVVPPGGTLAVTYTLRPVAEGRFTGSVDVCNPTQDFKSLFADIIVKKAAPTIPSGAPSP